MTAKYLFIYLLLFSLSVLFMNCNRECESSISNCSSTTPPKLPTCFDKYKKDESVKRILYKCNGTETYLWINTDWRFTDGPEYMVNIKCDTVCFIPGDFPPPKCITELNLSENPDDWQTAWKR
jgi:hypothetical protein